MEDVILGCHVGFKKEEQLLGSVREAVSYGANTFMFYTGAPQNTNRSSIDPLLTQKGIEEMKKNGIEMDHVVVHAPYIVNLANKKNHSFSITFLKEEIKRIESLGIKKMILHPGSHVDVSLEEGIQNIIEALNQILDENSKVTVCLETMAGKGSECGRTLEEIKEIMDGVNYPLMVCLDTCHLHDAGYDVKNFDDFLEKFDQIIGISKIGCVHINDSKNDSSSHKDRHENFGIGYIGFDALLNIVYHEKLKRVPKILETPYISKKDDDKKKIYPPYKFEIEMIRSKKMNQNLIEDIRKFYTSLGK